MYTYPHQISVYIFWLINSLHRTSLMAFFTISLTSVSRCSQTGDSFSNSQLPLFLLKVPYTQPKKYNKNDNSITQRPFLQFYLMSQTWTFPFYLYYPLILKWLSNKTQYALECNIYCNITNWGVDYQIKQSMPWNATLTVI